MIMSWYTRNLSTERFWNFNFLWLCKFYLTNFTFFFVSLTWRKQNRKQQHGGRLKLIKESVIILSLSSLLYIYRLFSLPHIRICTWLNHVILSSQPVNCSWCKSWYMYIKAFTSIICLTCILWMTRTGWRNSKEKIRLQAKLNFQQFNNSFRDIFLSYLLITIDGLPLWEVLTPWCLDYISSK